MACAELSDNLRILAGQLDLFTKSLVSISFIEAFDARVHSAEDLNKFREAIKEDVVDYASNTMPSCIEFVEIIKRFFTKWSTISFENWKSKLQDIINHIEKLQERCQTEYDKHVNLTSNFKKNQMEVYKLSQKMDKMSLAKNSEMKKLEKTAASYRRWDIGVKVILIGFFKDFGYSEKQESLAQDAARAGREIELSKDAKDILKNKLVPALSKIIDCLLKSSESLSKLRSYLRALRDQADDAVHEELEVQYNAMKTSTKDICKTCDAFYEIAPHVESDLRVLKSRHESRQ